MSACCALVMVANTTPCILLKSNDICIHSVHQLLCCPCFPWLRDRLARHLSLLQQPSRLTHELVEFKRPKIGASPKVWRYSPPPQRNGPHQGQDAAWLFTTVTYSFSTTIDSVQELWELFAIGCIVDRVTVSVERRFCCHFPAVWTTGLSRWQAYGPQLLNWTSS